MPLNRKVAVIGSAIRVPVTGDRQSLEELLYEVTQAALRDAGIGIDAIDGIVVASNDQFDGRAISVMAASGSVGGVDRDILSTPSAGEHAFVLGALRIASGLYETQLVVSWSPTEAHSLSEAQRLAADPYFHRRLPLDETSAAALQASSLAATAPVLHDRARARAENRAANKAHPSGRWPLASNMIAPPVTGAVAVVLASESAVAQHKPAAVAWMRGLGWATETGFLGDRDLATAPALQAAVERAYADAGVKTPGTAFDVAEVCDLTPYQEALVLDGLGLVPRAAWSGSGTQSSTTPINPSGGIAANNPVFCTGLIRIAEAANQVRGCASQQVKNVRLALAHAASGFAMQYQAVVVFGRDK